jgi:hypothetical protein
MNMQKKKLVRFGIGLALLAIYLVASGQWQTYLPARTDRQAPTTAAGASGVTADSVIAAFRAKKNRIMVSGQGRVVKVLPDDTQGIRHQRFILKLPSGLTILIAHNIDKAPRIRGLAKGDQVRFRGEYIFNDKGGLVHWTHRDHKGRHPDGWLEYQGRLYQ